MKKDFKTVICVKQGLGFEWGKMYAMFPRFSDSMTENHVYRTAESSRKGEYFTESTAVDTITGQPEEDYDVLFVECEESNSRIINDYGCEYIISTCPTYGACE